MISNSAVEKRIDAPQMVESLRLTKLMRQMGERESQLSLSASLLSQPRCQRHSQNGRLPTKETSRTSIKAVATTATNDPLPLL